MLDCPLITKDFIGHIPNPDQGIEHHDGRGITIDADLFGNKRNTQSPRVGPFENLMKGSNTFRIFTMDKAVPASSGH